MTRPAKPARPRGGSKPRVGDVAATARIEVVVTPATRAEWQAAGERLGLSISEMVRVAMGRYLEDTAPDGDDQAELAELARGVLALARGYEAG